jgi:hypothetical protein
MPGMPYDTSRSLVFFQADLNGGVPITTAFDVSADMTKVRDTFFKLSNGTWSYSAPTSNNIPQTITIYPVPSTVQQTITWINANAAAAPQIPATSTYSDVYIGHYTKFTGQTVNFGNCTLKAVADPVDAQDVATKNFVSNQISTLSTSTTSNIASSLTTAKAYTDTSVNVQKERIDLILDGSATNLDQFKEIVTLVNSLDATQAQDILTKTSALTTSINSEISRATTAEASLKKKSEFQIDVLPVASVYADCEQPYQMPNALKSNASFTGCDGWYFKNSTAGKKVNWYLPNVTSLKVSDIINLNFDATLFNIGSPPFITYYTQKKATGNAGSWYNAKTTYSVWDTTQLSTYKDYQFYTLLEPDTLLPNKTKYALTLDSVGSAGTMGNDDLILAITIGTNSAAAQNSVEFVCDKVRVVTANGTFSYNFSSFTTEINAISSSLSSTNTSLTSSINAVASNLSLEAARASTAETNLTNSISTELTRAVAAEAGLKSSIDTLSSILSALSSKEAADIAAEISRAQAAEATLTAKCNDLQSQLTVQTGYNTQIYNYLFGTAPSVVPTR